MKTPLIVIIILFISSCSTDQVPIQFGKDNCEFCKMTIVDRKFGAELLNKNGKAFKFDSGECLIRYFKSNAGFVAQKSLIINFNQPEELLDAGKSFYLHGGEINSPMGGQLAAFKTRRDAELIQTKLGGELLVWDSVIQINF